MTCFVSDGTIYDKAGNPIVPDENGMIELQEGEKKRRFVKEKFIDWLARNNKLIPPPQIKVKRTIVREQPKQKVVQLNSNEKKIKTWTKRKERKVRTDFTRKGIKILAKKGDKVFGPFISITKCAEVVKISKAQISKVMRGEVTNNSGFQFIKE